MLSEKIVESKDGKAPVATRQNTPDRNAWFACLAFTCLGLIVLSLIPLYLSTKDGGTPAKKRATNLTYQFPSSVRLAVARSSSGQVALIHDGSLNVKQRSALQTMIQNKLNANPRTKKIKVTLLNSSNVESSGRCKINSVSRPVTSRRLRRETTFITSPNQIIIVSQKTGSDSYTAVDLACDFACENPCPDSLMTYATDVVLAQLEFTGSSFIDLFYSGSSASTTVGSAAVLLPSTDPSLDLSALSNLQARTLQTLYYEQMHDRSIPVSGYRATIDYEFEVPTIVFDHSSLIYVVNQTDRIIVFGFGNVDAYAQTLGWPQAGIAMLFKGECHLSNANDVFMLSGFIYDASKLTLAANFTTSQMGNISSNTNVTFGRNDTVTNNTSSVGNPEPYLPNVRYVGLSFFSNASAKLNNVFYASLNASADSQFDDVAECHFNSLSQALLYDIVDPRNYNDPQAYYELAASVSSQDQPNSARSINDVTEKKIRESRQSSVTDVETADVESQSPLQSIFPLTYSLFSEKNSRMSSLGRRRRRRRRHLRPTIESTAVHMIAIRRRGIFGKIGKFFKKVTKKPVEAVKNSFNKIANTAKKAAKVVSNVGKLIKTAVVGGTYEKSGSFSIHIGYDQPKEIYRAGPIYVNCEECQVTGSITLHGKFNYGKKGLVTVLNEGFVEVRGNLDAKAVASIGISGKTQLKNSSTLATIPLTPIKVPGIFTLGPQAVLDVGYFLKVSGNLKVTFGAYINWDEIYTRINFKNPASSQSYGWTPSTMQPQLSYEAKLTADLGLFVRPKIELALSILNNVLKFRAGLTAQCTAGVTATNNGDQVKCPKGIQLSPYVEVGLSVDASAKLANNKLGSKKYSIFSKRFPIVSDKCIGGIETSTPDMPG